MIASIIVTGAVVAWPLIGYIRLTSMSRRLVDSWRQVDVQLMRRHDLVPSLANAVRGSLEPGRDALMSVAMNARAAALTATGPEDAASKEQRLSSALRRFWLAAASEPSPATVLFANTLGFKHAELFEMTDRLERAPGSEG